MFRGCRVAAGKESLLRSRKRNVHAKKQRKVKYDDVDRNLLNWCVGAFNANLEGNTRDTLLNKAQSIARDLGYSDEAICGLNLDWVKRFKARHNIASLKQSGEAASVPDGVVDHWKVEQLSAIREKFEDNDIFNLEETGLFWQVLPENTMQFKGQKCHGGKKSKQRITLLLGANATGSMKLPLLAIGKSAKKPPGPIHRQQKGMDDRRHFYSVSSENGCPFSTATTARVLYMR